MATMNEMDKKVNELFRKLDKLKAEGKDSIKGGEYDQVLSELRMLTRARLQLI